MPNFSVVSYSNGNVNTAQNNNKCPMAAQTYVMGQGAINIQSLQQAMPII